MIRSPEIDGFDLLRRRMRVHRAIRTWLDGAGFDEIDAPLLVRTPGMEPAIQAFQTAFVPELGSVPGRPLWLHTSPEYVLKRLLSRGWERPYFLGKVFRNGEVSPTHNPEFTLLEFYRAGADADALMADVEAVVRAAARDQGHADGLEWNGRRLRLDLPFERVSVRDALLRATGIDWMAHPTAPGLAAEARARGFHVPDPAAGATWDDVFFAVFLSEVEPFLGDPVPTFLVDYPAHMAALSRLSRKDPRVAERFELYALGLELCNGFTELTDPAEQRRRLEDEQAQRVAEGKAVYPLDEAFLDALTHMPDAAGVAVGVDRLAMLVTGAPSIADVLWFPADSEWRL